jgi:hypothetical protein
MTNNRKGRTGFHQATPKTSKRTCNSTGLGPRVKGCIVTLALWRLIPVAVADWIIHPGGLRDE